MEHDVIGAWPTLKWGIPAFLTPAIDKQRVGDTFESLHDSFTVNGADYWYSIPNHTVRNYENKLAQGATPSGQLRSVAPAWTFWAVESTMDEIAHASGEDPVDMRLRLLDGAGANAGGDKPQNVGGAKRLGQRAARRSRTLRLWRGQARRERGHGRRLRVFAGALIADLDGVRRARRMSTPRAAR